MMLAHPDEPHRRHDPLRDEWVLVSSGRTRRPWTGQVESVDEAPRLSYDPGCYLCPGNERAGGARNDDYESTFVFTNDFASLRPDTTTEVSETAHLLRTEGERGTCRVICFSPRHDLTMARMDDAGIRRTVDLWAQQYGELSREYPWVQVFENRGEVMGASNPHPHGQIWAGSSLPTAAVVEGRQQQAYLDAHGEPLLVAYARLELERDERVVVEGRHWVVVVPFWARWPFETLVLPREPVQRLDDLDEGRREDLTRVLGDLLVRYDDLFARSFPYSMGWHNAPGRDDLPAWTLHAHYYPPLLRADQQKFMVGYEMLAEAQRDFTPEEAAERLRSQPGRQTGTTSATGAHGATRR